MTDEYSTFKIKLIVQGHYHTSPGSPDYIDSDTLVTDEISAIDGPRTASQTVKLKLGALNYSLSPISFY